MEPREPNDMLQDSCARNGILGDVQRGIEAAKDFDSIGSGNGSCRCLGLSSILHHAGSERNDTVCTDQMQQIQAICLELPSRQSPTYVDHHPEQSPIRLSFSLPAHSSPPIRLSLCSSWKLCVTRSFMFQGHRSPIRLLAL